MTQGIWIFVEQVQGKIRKVSLELLTEGKKIAELTKEPLTAIILGEKLEALSMEVEGYGVDKIILADDLNLATYTTPHYTSVLSHLIRQEQPKLVLFGHTSIGKDLAPRLAQRLNVGLASDCTGIDIDSSNYISFKRPIYAGKAFAHVSIKESPIMATVRPNTFESKPLGTGHKAEVINISVTINPTELREIVKEVVSRATERPGLTESKIIVSGGRGIKGPENFGILEELADTLGAAIGASRAVVDAGWINHEFQVGQTGKTVAPTLYIACGISGAIQHLAGMGSSKYIVAINKDPDANIFNVADYGIVGDLFEIVPMLTEECKELVNK